MACNESAPAERLDPYPSAPSEWTDESMRKFINAQYNWAISAAKAFASVKADRKATADCLNKLRASGVIN